MPVLAGRLVEISMLTKYALLVLKFEIVVLLGL